MRFKKNLKIRDIAGEKVIIIQGKDEADLTKVLVLNSSSEWLWVKLFGKDFNREDVIGLLISKYGIDGARAEADTIEWIRSIEDLNLLEYES